LSPGGPTKQVNDLVEFAISERDSEEFIKQLWLRGKPKVLIRPDYSALRYRKRRWIPSPRWEHENI